MAFGLSTERQKQFKKGIDADESRRRREDTTIQIRKTKKEERLNQRRRMVHSILRSTSKYVHLTTIILRFLTLVAILLNQKFLQPNIKLHLGKR